MSNLNKKLDGALDAFNHEKYEEAYRLLLPLAEDGVPKAQACLGSLYQLGLGVERNILEAIRWLKLAAEQGEGVAAHNLGTIYMSSSEVHELDREESKKWYRKARELGFEVAPPEWYE